MLLREVERIGGLLKVQGSELFILQRAPIHELFHLFRLVCCALRPVQHSYVLWREAWEVVQLLVPLLDSSDNFDILRACRLTFSLDCDHLPLQSVSLDEVGCFVPFDRLGLGE